MNVKNGFTTLNRLLGKKSKSQTISKSTSNLSIKPQSQYDTSVPLSSQLEHNSLTSIPTAASNAPFEQTFRITVLLPKNQLYVTRLGARTELATLLKLVCENKRLDPTKYEFRHPADNSQVFCLDQTLGAVGLCEVRLCLKSESYDNFNATEIINLRNTAGRDSLSSSEFSSRNSKNTLKTASPYSSTNSLNSSDSAGMSLSYRGTVAAHPSNPQKPPVAPARKKRTAPRPPSQQSTITNGGSSGEQTPTTPIFKEPLSLTRQEFHVSTPNLTQCTEMTLLRAAEFHKSNVSVDCNGNSRSSRDNNSLANESNGHLHCNGSTETNSNSLRSPTLSPNMRPVSMSILNSEIHYEDNELNGNRELAINSSTTDLSQRDGLPEPAPRKRIIIAKKKAAPAPPPRGLQPIATPRITTTPVPPVKEVSSQEEISTEDVTIRASTLNDSKLPEVKPEAIEIKLKDTKDDRIDQPPCLPASSPPPLESDEAPEIKNTFKAKEVEEIQSPPVLVTNGFKDVETSPPEIKTPPPTSENPASHSTLESKLSLESSDDDDQVNVYNLKLGKTTVTPLATYENKTESSPESPKVTDTPMTSSSPKPLSIETETTSSPISTISPTTPLRAESPEWSYMIPAPPTFADNDTVVATCRSTLHSISPVNGSILSDTDELLSTNSLQSEVMITSDIEDGYRGGSKEPQAESTKEMKKEKINVSEVAVIVNDINRSKKISPPESPTDLQAAEVINELNNIINENGGTNGSLKRHSEKNNEAEIETAKPCALSNFTIQSYSTKPVEEIQAAEKPAEVIFEEENLYVKSGKRPSLTLSNSIVGQLSRHRGSVTRSDSFHSTSNQNRNDSHTSLATDQRFSDSNQRKSSSELSIGEIPSLQSPLIMKSILNSRKNSLNGNFSSISNLKSPDIVEAVKPAVEGKTNSAPVEPEETVYRRTSAKDTVSISSVAITPDSIEKKLLGTTVEPKINGFDNSNYSLPPDYSSISENHVTVPDDCDSSKENSPKNKIVSQTKISSEQLTEKVTSEPSKTYRYQGPPSINLSTWSERPKVQVAIKSDQDYIFGVGKNRLDLKSQPLNGNVVLRGATATAPVMRNIEYKKTVSMVDAPIPRERKISEDSPQQILATQPPQPRPFSMYNSMTLNRNIPKINRGSFVPVVKGFKSLEAAIPVESNEQPSKDDIVHTTVLRAGNIVRSNSAVSTHILRLSIGNNISTAPAENGSSDTTPQSPQAYFSQIALRKTGLKEKILANSDTVDSVPSKSSTQRVNNQKEPQNCAKLELKLTTTVTSNPTHAAPNPNPKPQKPNPTHRHTIASEIPPPPPPIIRSLVTKQNSLGKSACIPDTRDQLLIAIRNFNKDSLNVAKNCY